MSHVPTINAQLSLLSIQPQQNRYRYYRIRIRTVNILASFYLITFSWGRLHRAAKHKVVSCANEEELSHLLHQVLKTRLRHNYQILERSSSFPDYEILTRMSSCSLPSQQLTLFNTLLYQSGSDIVP